MGPLEGVKVVELAGIGPAPFAGMMLADMGADVVRIERGASMFGGGVQDFLGRGRRSVAIDLKNPQGLQAALRLIEKADVLLEGFRPGVMERLGLGPEVCLERNPKLVFGRMTGWGQTGPWSQMAGHDLNYIASVGALHSFAREGQAPVPPLNAVGDFGGGGMLLAFGVLCGVIQARVSGRGQVIDAAMVDGSALLMTLPLYMRALGMWQDTPGTNLFDTGAPFYDVYETSDGRYLSIGALEPKFYAEMVRLLALDPVGLPHQMDQARWPELRGQIAAAVKQKTLSEWAALAAGTDACMVPVLSFPEAFEHPHLQARGTFVAGPGGMQAAPAPRFSATPTELRTPPLAVGQHTDEVFRDWGVPAAEVEGYRVARALQVG